MSLLRSAAVVGFFTMISRLFGFVRDILIATFIGANALTDAFFVAFKIPNFMRRLFAEGAFNSAFVPLYSGELATGGGLAAKRFASETKSALIMILLAVVVVMEIFMPQCMLVLAPGFDKDPEKFALAVTLTRITLPYILFISLVSLLGGILNSMSKFAAVAACPILLNVTMIVGLLFFRESFPTPAHMLSTAVFIAGILQFSWLVWFCHKEGVLPPLIRPRMTEGVKRLLVLIAPAALGAGVAQVNLMVDMIIASTVPEGVSYLYYADRINQLPLGVIGVGVGTALLPLLSRQLREGKNEIAMHSQNRAIELVLLLALPSAAALLVIAQPIIATLFEHGAFSVEAAAQTYPALMAFAFGLPAFVLVKVLAPGFFANHDTKTPFIIATICMALNLALNLILVNYMAHVGLALATSVAGWVNVGLMAWKLHERGLIKADDTLRHRAPRIVLASGAMAVVLAASYSFSAPLFSGALWERITALSILILIGAGFYCFMILSTKAITWAEVKALLKRQR